MVHAPVPFRFVLSLSLLTCFAALSSCSASDASTPVGSLDSGQGGSPADGAAGSGQGGTLGDGAAGSAGTHAGGAGGTSGGGAGGATAGSAGAPGGTSVLQHHRNAARDGAYVDEAFTHTAAAGLHRVANFNPVIEGKAYAQPLLLDNGTGGKPTLLVATEHNNVYAIDASDGSIVWQHNLGDPVALSNLPCGNIDPLGITGTPVIDAGSRTLLVDAMTTPDGGSTKKHLIFRMSVDDGSILSGWPVDVSASVNAGATAFDSTVQNQRGALAILGGNVYVPYGGHWGDCGNYHGWVVGIALDSPGSPKAWATPARGGGSWAPSGVASDGSSLFIATGNTFEASTWSGGEAIVRLDPGPLFSGTPDAFFSPSNWKALDDGDVDIGGTGPVLVDVPGAVPSQLAISLGKNGVGYLLDRNNLGGISAGDGVSGEGLYSAKVSNIGIINAAAAYATSQGVYVVFKGNGSSCPQGQSGDLTAIKIAASAPPTFSTAWCASQNGLGSPMVTTTDGHANPIVWGVGAEQGGRLVGFDGDTGAVVFDGGGAQEAIPGVVRYVTPIAAMGTIYVAGGGTVYAFSP